MATLEPNNNFLQNLELLFGELGDEDVQRIIEDNIEAIILLAKDNTAENREIIDASINDLIEVSLKQNKPHED